MRVTAPDRPTLHADPAPTSDSSRPTTGDVSTLTAAAWSALRRQITKHRRSLRSSRRRRQYLVRGLAVLVLLGIAWLAVTAVLAANRAHQLNARLEHVRNLVARGDIAGARRESAAIPALARDAHDLTTGPAWWLAAHIPYLGKPVEIVRGTATAGMQIGVKAVPLLIDVATEVDPAKLRSSGDSVRLAPLIKAAPKLAVGARVMDEAVRQLDSVPHHSWVARIDRGRASLAAELASISGYVDAAARLSKVLPEMLGSQGPRRYFIVLQNPAESRGTGGLPGAFAIAVANHGKLTFTHFESDVALLPAATGQLIHTGLTFGAGYGKAYGPSDPTNEFLDSNVSPNFPYSARIWARMWELTSGEHIDGAMAIDPTMLSAFLAATQSSTVVNGVAVNAANVVALTEAYEYVLYPDEGQRKGFLVSIMKATAHLVISGSGRAVDIANAFSRGSQEHRVLVWSANASAERVLQQTPYAGQLPVDDRPTSVVAMNNLPANKLDYYVYRTLGYQRSGCGPSRDVVVTETFNNLVPASGLPILVTERFDYPRFPVKPGDDRVLLDYYATRGAQLSSITVNGKPATAGVETDLGHPIFRTELELPRGQTQTVVWHLTEPAGTGSPLIVAQPGSTPVPITVFDQPCD